MDIMDKHDAVALQTKSGKIVCTQCLMDEDCDGATEDRLITRDQVANDKHRLYFCDICRNQIQPGRAFDPAPRDLGRGRHACGGRV